jgi:hypothetical protein
MPKSCPVVFSLSTLDTRSSRHFFDRTKINLC